MRWTGDSLGSSGDAQIVIKKILSYHTKKIPITERREQQNKIHQQLHLVAMYLH
jgi:hypothetical protein